MKRKPKNKHDFECIIPFLMDIDTFQILKNHVLIEFDPKQNEKTTSGLFAPVGALNHDVEVEYAPRIGKVIKLPKKLYYKQNDFANSMRWLTTIELEVGDKVWTNHFTLHDHQFTWQGKYYKLVLYEDIVCAKRGEEVIMLNGYMLCKPLYEEVKILKYERTERLIYEVEVEHIGELNLEYQDPRKHESTGIEVGDRILLLKDHTNKVFFLEAEYFQWFDGKEHAVIQSYMVGGVLTEA